MKLHAPRKSIEKRCLLFLQDLHGQIHGGDDEPRVVFTAMKHHLSWNVVKATQDLGIIRRSGWKWAWMGKRPTVGMAQAVREEGTAALRGIPLHRRPKARKRYRTLINNPR